MVEQNNFYILLTVWKSLGSDENVAGVWITVYEALFIDHIGKSLRNKLGTLFEVDTLSVHFTDICCWDTFLERHG